MWMQIESVYANMPYLALLGVRRDYRSHGIGQMLLKYFIQSYESKGYDRGFIAVNDFNPLARRLYEDMGFHKFMQMPESLDPSHNLYLLMRKTPKHNSNV
jgi:ribosomal protein S18 acetylase RimI-like enzyme